MAVYAGIIARVSTQKQLDNTSPDEQLRRCREYCREQGYSIAAEKVEAISGAFVLARSDFMELLELAEKKKLSVIVADIPDRLGRGEAISKLELLAELHGARIEYARPGRDKSTVEGFIQHSTDQLVSGIERLNIGRRTREGKQARVREGQVIATIYRPYGYNIVSKYDDRGRKISCMFEICEEEAPVIVMIYEWYVYEGLSVHAITKRLSEQGIPTFASRRGEWAKTPLKKKQWYSTTVRKILHNKTYCGEWHYGKREIKRLDRLGKIRYETHLRPESEHISVQVPAIISVELWEAAQKRLAENKRKGHKPTKHQYLLRGRIRCAACGCLFCASSVGKYRYYRCRRNSSNYFGDNRCPAGHIKADHIEPKVWAKIVELMQDKNTLFEKIQVDREEAERASKMIRMTIAALEAQNQKTQAKLDRYLELYGEGGMSKATYAAKKQEIEKEIERRNAERGELEAQIRQHPILSPDDEAELRRLQADIALGIEKSTFEERVKLLNILRVEGVYDYKTGDLTISGALGIHILSIKSGYGTNRAPVRSRSRAYY